MKPRIFVSAYACEPGLGSELGVGWHWVLEMSKAFELWVLTRESNRHTIEPWIAAHPEFSGIHFIYFDLPKWARFWKKGLRGVRTYYNIWQRLTNRIVRATMQENDIHTFHHLTYGNALWPVSSYGSKQTFIWGPIGGLETISEDFTRHYDRRSRLIEQLRRFAVGRAVGSRSLKRRAGRADLILCKTDDTLHALPAEARRHAVLMTDVATDTTMAADIPSPIPHSGLRCIAVGRLDAWRGFDLAIEAVAQATKRGTDATLTIVGKGVDRQRLERIAEQHAVGDRITFTGNVDREKYQQLMQQADVVLNPSLKEGAVTVSFDAMAMGKPLVALDTGGYTRYFEPTYSIVIPRTHRHATITALADALQRLSDNALRMSMADEARKASAKFTWDHHGREICTLISNTIAQH